MYEPIVIWPSGTYYDAYMSGGCSAVVGPGHNWVWECPEYAGGGLTACCYE